MDGWMDGINTYWQLLVKFGAKNLVPNQNQSCTTSYCLFDGLLCSSTLTYPVHLQVTGPQEGPVKKMQHCLHFPSS